MRHDQTKWLIHFVRDRNPEQDFPGETEEEFNKFSGGELEYDADAFSVLNTIVRLGGLIAGHSFRSGKTTIYGGEPVVCATEMPIYAFASYAKQASKAKNVSAYGVAFLKSEFYKAGGRPVIYGLSADGVKYEINHKYCRIISPDFLPKDEQYRFVAYNPTQSNWVDWSHEREWRWKVKDSDRDYIYCMGGSDCYEQSPGIPLFSGKLNGGVFTKLCVIVWNHEEAEEIQKSLTGFYLAGGNNYGTEFDKKLLERSSILVLEDVIDAVENKGELNAQTIEGLQEANLLSSIIVTSAPSNAADLISAAFDAAKIAGKFAADAYLKKNPLDKGCCGFAHVATDDVVNPLVQFMLKNDLATGPYDGRVHINVGGNWKHMQSVDYQEHICEAMAESLEASLSIEFYMHSRLD